MKRELAQAVVACLRLSEDASDVEELRQFGVRDWQRTIKWLDDSGLALYFLQHLRSKGATEVVAPEILAQLEGSFVENQFRWEYLAEGFAGINESFQQAGVSFAVIKGLSLVPEYCPDAVLRAPSDLDYLIDRHSLPLARHILESAGYRLQKCTDFEFKFCKPSPVMPTTSDSPYSIKTEPLVELHLAFWNPANGVPLTEPVFPLEQTIPHSWRGLRFPVLNERDAFLLQVLHVFQHTLECWVKLCWLFEIGFFLSRRSVDSGFWRQVDERIQSVPHLAEFAAIVIELAKIVFAAPTPSLAKNWMHSLPPTSRLWLETYAEMWAFDDHPWSRSRFFPTAKLALFLHQEYIPNSKLRKEVIRQRLFPWKRPERVAFPVDHKPGSMAAARRLQWRWALDRVIFHSGSSLRYLWEVPRWRKLKS
jgi:Uncharacterised nucleotidyltransferase